ncbi:hypothetical protein B0H12DRAFT_199664 [Mycena haematopus]|nr:hypothetical protein B0H12DRAFT_199664 [Mycena haematopus]
MLVTPDEVCLVRADSLGVEECAFRRDSSRGVFDMMRICAGLARSTAVDRGQHEAFRLHDTTTLAPPHIQPSSPDAFGAKEAEAEMEYTHRTARFITLKAEHVHYPPNETQLDTTFYVHSVLQHSDSLVGRVARIFCVSREVGGEVGGVGIGVGGEGATRSFVGPYALKIYYADHESECYKEDLIAVARRAQVKNLLLPTAEWRYGDALSMRGFPADIVGQYPHTPAVPKVATNREEVFELSEMKRVLAQASDYAEFSRAFVDVAEGAFLFAIIDASHRYHILVRAVAIASLAETGLVHRDISIGNVLLSRDMACPPAFFDEAASLVQEITNQRAVFSPRELDGRVGVSSTIWTWRAACVRLARRKLLMATSG